MMRPTATATASRSAVMLGAGGHAKVVLSLAQALGYTVTGVCDPALDRQSIATWREVPVLGGDDAIHALDVGSIVLINGVGQLPGGLVRRNLFEKYRKLGFRFPPLVHPFAWVEGSASLAEGVQIMAGAVIQADCRIGENSIINTRASIDHDARIGAHVHVAPGATLCGGVSVGSGAFIGAGATVIQGVTIEADHCLKAARLLTHDAADRASPSHRGESLTTE